jgi:polysaccharide deacetylase family protein (PEP-CTERM system associated)
MGIKNILTVDVEDWYHICDIESILPRASWDRCENRVQGNVEKILALFSRFHVRATFFILGYLAEKMPELVKTIHREGHEIASHGYGHIQVYKLTKEEFLQDLLRAKDLIENILQNEGVKVTGFRAPEWSICSGKRNSYWALDLLAENGFVYDSSIAPLRFIGIPDAPTTPYAVSTAHGTIQEFPPLVTWSLFGNLPIGGGWGLRIFPYRMIQKAIRRLNGSGYPALIFCHPTDFDPCPPRISLPWVKRFVCRGKIRTTEERMIRLLSDFEFGALREAGLG